jgi:uncharacterized membrane protein YkoI
LATITADQAAQSALAANPGTVIKTALEDENGNVVYGVEIQTANGRVDVKVDAGTGKVLHTEHDDANETESEVPEAPAATPAK